MPTFSYTTQNDAGAVTTGTLSALNHAAALQDLKRRGLRIIDLKTASPLTGNIQLRNPGPNGMDMSLFCSQFALMARAGVSQTETLQALTRTTSNRKLQAALEDVRQKVDGGILITRAMAEYPLIFDRSFVALMTAAIRTDTVAPTMDRLSTMYERNVKVQQEVKSALVQPAITIILAFLVIILLSIVVIPQFKSMLEGMNVPLPIYTRLLIATSEFMRSWLVIFPLAIIIGSGIAFQKFNQTEKGKVRVDELLLKIPKVGSLILLGSLSRINRTLSTLLSNGIAKNDSIDIAAKASGNAVLERILQEGRAHIEQGGLLYQVLERYPKQFPATITGMVSTGERQGELAPMLDRVADFYERQVENDAKNLTKTIEPLMYVVIGVMVGGIVLAIMAPLSSMIAALSK